ncbi:MAG: AMP-binding protein [Pseudomonadota bacterium]|nr:AMP-binding protein [Pseudomonadota bacterium]
MNMAEHLARSGRVFPDLPAVAVGTRVTHDYRTLAARAAGLAAGLTGTLGLKRGDRVAILQKNGAHYTETLYGIWWAGLVAVPVNAKLHPKEIAWITGNSGAALVITSADLADDAVEAGRQCDPAPRIVVAGSPDYERLVRVDIAPAAPAEAAADDLAWIFYTSGTTGRPKGAMLSHLNLLMMTLSFFTDLDSVAPGDAIIHAAPMSHGSGMYALPHVLKGGINVVPESGGFDPAETLELIACWPGSGLFFAPTMVHRLIHAPQTAGAVTTNLKTIWYGGGPMYVADLLAAMDLLGPKFVQLYGQGEAPMTITGLGRDMHLMRDHPRWRERLGSTGIARSDVEVRVVDGEDRPLPPGETGEVVVRGPVVMRGYWNNPAASAETLKGGWLHTGDVGVFDEDGFLTLKDRSKDMIISGGTNIYPREIEEVLLTHPDVAEVSVVGRPHPDWGEEVVAFVVQSGKRPAEAELDRLCLDSIARFKRPKAYIFMESLPKNNYGKVLKTELRKVFGNGER